jgi:hypothetical protein
MLQDKWEPGQHLTIDGPTGCGKTWVASDIVRLKNYIVVMASKKQDGTLEKQYRDFKRVERFNPQYGETKFLLWPRPKYLGDIDRQRNVYARGLNEAWLQGAWTIQLDDVFYLAQTLKMYKLIQTLYTQARSEDISLVGLIQRASWVPIEVSNQSTYFVMFYNKDIGDIQKISHINGQDWHEIKYLNDQLHGRDFLFIDKDGAIIIRR